MNKYVFLQNKNHCNTDFKKIVDQKITNLISNGYIVIKYRCPTKENSTQFLGAIIWYK